jgi:cell division protein FtsQ
VSGVSTAPKKAAPKAGTARRDYDRRKKRAPIRKSGRPFWRQPLLLGVIVLLLGCGGGGGWWAWHEGWLVEAQNRIDSASRAVVGAITPFKLADVTVEGRDYVERSAILAALNVSRGDSLLGIDLQASRRRLESIDWVEWATVERRLPDTLYVTLKERRAVAIWQNGNEYTLIDKNGRTCVPAGCRRAPKACCCSAVRVHLSMSAICCCCSPTSLPCPGSCARPFGSVSVRWNLVLNNGVEIWLPEEDAVAALQQLAKLDGQHKLLSREFGVVDLRLPDKLYLRKRNTGEPTPGPA